MNGMNIYNQVCTDRYGTLDPGNEINNTFFVELLERLRDKIFSGDQDMYDFIDDVFERCESLIAE